MKNNHLGIDIQTCFQERLIAFKQILKDKCKIGISTQNAYDAMAVAQGLDDYQTAKGLVGAPVYTLRANLGMSGEGFWISKALGQHASVVEAIAAAEKKIESCNEFIQWIVFKDGKVTPHTLNSTPKLSGTHVTLKLRDKSLIDIESNVKAIFDDLSSGCIHKKVSTSSGCTELWIDGQEQYSLIERPHIVETTHYAIVGKAGVVDKSPFRDLFTERFTALSKKHTSDPLTCATSITYDDFKKLPDLKTCQLTVVPVRTQKIAVFQGGVIACNAYMEKNANYRFYVFLHEKQSVLK